jgi:CPA1 family monovalent cation:H+ antiporter
VLGIAIGLAVGLIVGRLREHLTDPPVEITISLLTPYAAYLPADALGASGVLACVACGLYLGRLGPRIMGADTRLQGRAVWEMVIFTFNGLLFLLIGLQFPSILSNLGGRPLSHVLGLGLLISATVVLIRFAWVFARDLPRLVSSEAAVRARIWREDVVVAWSGLRGAVSLAAALALPLAVADGSPFPERALLIFITMCVILLTLVGQGLTLPLVLRRVRLRVEELDAQEEATAREVATQAAQHRIEELAEAWPTHLPLIETLRTQYEHRASHLDPPAEPPDGRPAGAGPSDAEQELIDHRAIRGSVIDAQREAILDLRDSGQIGDNALRALERELDLEELRMEA